MENQNIEKSDKNDKYVKVLEKAVTVAGIVATVGTVLIKALKNRK